MADWIATFDYPEGGWIELDMTSTDVAEEAAQEIADRGGELAQEYAEEAYEELKAIRDGALARNASPVIVFVPDQPRQSRPLVPISAFVAPVAATEEQRTVEALTALARRPRSYRYREPDIEAVELPAGPAVRVRELVTNEKGDDDRQVLMEYVSYYVIPPGYPDGVVEFTITWASPVLGPVMAETADEMATTLTIGHKESTGVEE